MGLLKDYLDLRLADLERTLMSQLSDKIAEVTRTQDEAIARVQEDVSDLQRQIDDLRTKVTTPEDIAALDAIQVKNEALDPISPVVLPEP
jgi:hypothetical protein